MAQPKLQWHKLAKTPALVGSQPANEVCWMARLSDNQYPLGLYYYPQRNIVRIVNHRAVCVRAWMLPLSICDLPERLAEAELLALQHVREIFNRLMAAYSP